MNKMHKTMMLAIGLILATMGQVNAQKAVVGGRVTDRGTGEAMPFVNVALMRPADTVFVRGGSTDMEGRFTIADVDTGRYLMQASFVGYHTWYEEVTITKTTMRPTYEIALVRGTTLAEVKVTADRPLYLMDGEKNMYNAKEDPSIQTGTASDALQNAPGVEVDAEGNITLRGVSSVEIWINDRPSHMNEEALKQYIKTMPAGAIERIEVITNPSARYSTSGGVINIVTNQKVSRNELLCLGLQAATTPTVSPWVSYVWANEKVDFNFYLNGRYGTHEFDSEGTSTLLGEGGDTSRYQSHREETHAPNVGGYAGFNINWNIDSMTTLSAWMGAYPGWGESHTYGNYTYHEHLPLFTDLSYTDTADGHNFWGGGYAGAWFMHRFDTTGRKVSVNFNGNLWSNENSNDEWRRYTVATARNFDRRNTGHYFGPSASLGVDYTLPLKHGIEVEAGAEMGFSHNVNIQLLDTLNTSGSYDNVSLRSYSADGTAWQPAAYVTAQKRWGSFTAKVGLRGEGTFEYGQVSHPADIEPMPLEVNRFGLVPSLHLSYQTKTFTSYSLSYTRRFTDALDMIDLSNFRIYDDYSFRTGNPALQRSYTHNLEAAFNQYVMNFGNIGLNAYFRANSGEHGTMTDTITDLNLGPYLVNYTYPVNIGTSHTEGIEANITYRPTGFFNVRLNASVFNYGYRYDGEPMNHVSWSARLNVWAKVWNRLELFANAHYTSPRLGLYSMSVPNRGLDFGLSSDFFDRQLSVNLKASDIFGWAQWGENTQAPNYQTTGSQHFNSTYVSLGITWRIGKMELESKARQGATEGNTPKM